MLAQDLQDSFEVLLPVITQLVTRLSTMQQPLPQATHAVLASVRDLLLAGTRAVDVVMLGTPGKDMQLADQIAAWNVRAGWLGCGDGCCGCFMQG